MQAPATLNLNCWQGASFDYNLTWLLNGTAVALGGTITVSARLG